MIEKAPQEVIPEEPFHVGLGVNQSRRYRGDFAFSRRNIRK
jgi:hypothetical protein